MEKEQLLRNPDIFPSDEVLAAALGDCYSAYEAFAAKLPEYGVETEWRYYKDGKNWLTKGVYKKKTVFWLSVWDGHFMVSFFFTDRTREGVFQLSISDALKERFANEKRVGKLIALLVEVYDETALADLYALVGYKRSLK